MATTAARDHQPDAAPEAGIVVRASPRSPQRNRLLALVLASIAASVFVLVMIAAVLFHYAEINHALPGF